MENDSEIIIYLYSLLKPLVMLCLTWFSNEAVFLHMYTE